MEKLSLTKAIGFAIYMLIEHHLGKCEVGSVIGLVKGTFSIMIDTLRSKFKNHSKNKDGK